MWIFVLIERIVRPFLLFSRYLADFWGWCLGYLSCWTGIWGNFAGQKIVCTPERGLNCSAKFRASILCNNNPFIFCRCSSSEYHVNIMLEMDLIKLFNSIKKLPYILNFKRVQIELRVHKNVLYKFPNYKKNPFHSRIFHILTSKDHLK